MRVVSMVPSWTETLLEAGVDVVGRTRFCIHPKEKVKEISVVGGTKNIEWQSVANLKPDILLLDKEENPKSMFDESKFKTLITHITSVDDVPREINKLSVELKAKQLKLLAERWQDVIEQLEGAPRDSLASCSNDESKKRGIITWIKKPPRDLEQIVYVIWKNPYMAIAKETFIGSVLKLLNLDTHISVATHGKRYPEIKLEDFDPDKTLFLFSSEPFPFHKKTGEIGALGLYSAIVDGESFSWFGARSLKFLENQIK